MRTVYLIRHAKSSWNDTSLSDFDRPLNDRGKHDAPVMAKRLHERRKKIDAFISSPAKRALKTCRIFTEEYDFNDKKILIADELYNASYNVYNDVITAIENEHKHIAIFAHNPGITDFANSLCEAVHIDNMPTCSIFAVQADIKEWSDFNNAKKGFLFFDYPKLVGG